MANQYKNVQMLNPYKFATYQFMKQYFSVSPRMYMEFSNSANDAYSYNDIIAMIEPFEMRFTSNSNGYHSNIPDNDTSWYHPTDTFKNSWSKCISPMGLIEFNGIGSGQWLWEGVADCSSNNADLEDLLNTFLYSFAGKPSNCFYLTNINYSKYPAETYPDGSHQDQYTYRLYHYGHIFPAFIPIYTRNKPARHAEFMKVSYKSTTPVYNTRQNDYLASENFFSTTTRTGYMQEGGYTFGDIEPGYTWGATGDSGNPASSTYSGHKQLLKVNKMYEFPCSYVTNLRAHTVTEQFTFLGWDTNITANMGGLIGRLYKDLNNIASATVVDNIPGVSATEQALIYGRIHY